MTRTGLFAVAAILLGSLASPASLPAAAAQDPDIIRGGRLVEQKCGQCHATGRTDASKRREAPAFRTLARKYPLQHLAEALAEGITTGHNDMPEFVFEPEEIDAILAYIASISEGQP